MRNKKLDGYVYASMLATTIPELQDEAPRIDIAFFYSIHPLSLI